MTQVVGAPSMLDSRRQLRGNERGVGSMGGSSVLDSGDEL